jgi:peptide/nickel transport system permease protein
MAFPFILLAIAVVGVLGPSPAKVVLVVGVGGWVHFARVVRSEVLSLRERAFIEGARATGAGDGRILVRHVLPNVLPTILVLATTALAYAIVAESSLSFLGVGIPASTPSWGTMLADGRQYVDTAWWLATFPGLCILVTALTATVLGDLVRDARAASPRTARVGVA